jgi:hypothetical protein
MTDHLKPREFRATGKGTVTRRAALEALVVHLRDGTPMPPEIANVWIESSEKCLAGENGGSLDKAIGLKSHGGISIVRESKLEQRNQIIRDLWRTAPEFRNLPAIAAAKVMQLSAERYEANRWRREQDFVTAPASAPAAAWWNILQLGETIPKAKRLQSILEIQEGL